MANSADPDQLKKSTDRDLYCLQSRAYPGSAGPGLNAVHVGETLDCINAKRQTKIYY